MRYHSQYIQVSTTVAKKKDAEMVSKFLSDKKLSACTQIVGPITSIYRWQGKLKKSKEWVCVVKTKEEHYQKVEKAIKAVHPYDLPEIVAVPITKGSLEYFEWMRKEL